MPATREELVDAMSALPSGTGGESLLGQLATTKGPNGKGLVAKLGD